MHLNMSRTITPCRLEFFRIFELANTGEEVVQQFQGYYVLGEYDFFRVKSGVRDNFSDIDNTSANQSRPASSVLASWVPRTISIGDHGDVENGVDQLRITTGFLCRVDLAPTKTRQYSYITHDTIRELQTSTPPNIATGYINNQLSFIEALYAEINKSEITCFLSVGSYSVYVLFKDGGADFQDILSRIKSIRISGDAVIGVTTTIALVSTGHLNTTEPHSALPPITDRPVTSAQVLISSASMPPDQLGKTLADICNTHNLSSDQYEVLNTLGDFDFSLRLKNQSILKIAKLSLEIHKIQGIHAKTSLEWTPTETQESPLPLTSDTPTIALAPLKGLHSLIASIPLDCLSHSECRMLRRWQKEFHWVISHIELALFDPSVAGNAVELLGLIVQRILPRLMRWAKNPALPQSFDTTLNILSTAVTQRKQPRLLPPLDYPLAETTLSQGAGMIICAITRYICALFIHARNLTPAMFRNNSHPPYWQAAVVFDYEDGFICYPDHLFSIPFEAAFSPVSETSWQTLSHEVSHAIYADLKLYSIAETTLDELLDVITPPGNSFVQKHQLKQVLEDDCREIVAHWLDANYFHNKDTEGYLRSIWATWRRRAEGSQHPHLKAYVARSFIVWCALAEDKSNLFEHISRLHLHPISDWEKYTRDVSDIFSKRYNTFSEKLFSITGYPTLRELEIYRSHVTLEAAWHLVVLSELGKYFGDFDLITPRDLTANDKMAYKSMLDGEIYLGRIDSPIEVFRLINIESIQRDSQKTSGTPAYEIIQNKIEMSLIMALTNCNFFPEEQ